LDKSPGAPSLSDAVAQQYERYPYPEPAADLHDWHRNRRLLPDPEQQHLVFWPDRDYPQGLDILIAGCGANQAAELAFHNPTARILGIDVSSASLASQQRLKDLHGLSNLELRRHPIEEVAALGRDFDLIVSTGVLHHMADPDLGLRELGRLLRPDGVMSLMLYSKYGWSAVRVMWEFFEKLGLDMSRTSVDLIREALDLVPANHPIRNYIALGPDDLGTDSGIVDSFLHPRARIYSVPEILDMVERAGLRFQGWQSNYLYYPEGMPGDSSTYRAVNALPEPKIWAAMELFYAAGNATHFFHVCRTDRPERRYAIGFDGAAFLGYVPVPTSDLVVERAAGGGTPLRLRRRGIDCPLAGLHSAAFALVDGRRSIGEIVDTMRGQGIGGDESEKTAFARVFFRSLWRLELIYIRLPADRT
jgi:SAM-dependent methyltransferase